MSYAKANKWRLSVTLLTVIVLMGFAVWQFYRFVNFGTTTGIDSQGGEWHLWAAIIATVFACCAGFFFLSTLVQRDREDELHITSGFEAPH